MSRIGSLFILLAICLLTEANAFAQVPTTLKFSDRSFKVEFSDDRRHYSDPASLEELQLSITDPKLSDFDISSQYLNLLFNQRWPARRPTYRRRQQLLHEYHEAYGRRLADLIEQAARRNGGKLHRDGPYKIITLPDGVAFFADYYETLKKEEPFVQAMGHALMKSLGREFRKAGTLQRLISTIESTGHSTSFLLSPDHFTEQDLQKLNLISDGVFQYARVGETWLFGSGFSFLLTKELLQKGQNLKDAKLREQFNKIVRYQQGIGLPVIYHYRQGAVAYFDELNQVMSFGMPSQASINTYTHEITHSRFAKFTKTLDRWAKSKGYLIPFQVDGPSSPGANTGSTHGGFFTLLNEVNSWRIGEGYDGGATDAEIIKGLTDYYGELAGQEATELFAKVWTPAKLEGKSIPYLLYNEIREFNKLSPADVLRMALEGMKNNDLVAKMNFLIFYKAQRFQNTPVAADAEEIFQQIASSATEKMLKNQISLIKGQSAESPSGAETETSSLSEESSFEAVLTEFIKKGSSRSARLLTSKYLTQLTAKHIDPTIEKGFDSSDSLNSRVAIGILRALLERENVPEVTTVSRTGGLTVRAPVASSPLLQAIDEALASRLYDGKWTAAKMDFTNFIAAFFHPLDLPKTLERTLTFLTSPKDKAPIDSLVAKMFFWPDTDVQGRNGAWGEHLVRTLRSKPADGSLKEAMALHYQLSTAAMISRNFNFESGQLRLDVGTHEKIKAAMARLDSQQKERLDFASTHLWELVHDARAQIRTAALYAMLSNPMFVVRNEGRIIHALEGHDQVSAEALTFLLDVAGDLLPAASRIRKLQQQKASQRRSAPLICADLF